MNDKTLAWPNMSYNHAPENLYGQSGCASASAKKRCCNDDGAPQAQSRKRNRLTAISNPQDAQHSSFKSSDADAEANNDQSNKKWTSASLQPDGMDEDVIMAKMIAESKKQFQKDKIRRRQFADHPAAEVIAIDDDDDDDVEDDVEDDRKMPAHQQQTNNNGDDVEGDRKMPAHQANRNANEINNGMDEQAQIEEATRRSLAESKPSVGLPQYNVLKRKEFEDVINSVIAQNGGYERIENGEFVKEGNRLVLKKDRVAKDDGNNQKGAQYGRFTIKAMWRMIDVLEGRANMDIGVPTQEASCKTASEKAATKINMGRHLKGPACAKIKAFVDIGHGLGIQVLQAGWSLNIRSRGVELMPKRCFISDILVRRGVLDSLRTNPPDDTLIEMKESDFSAAVTVKRDKKGKRDEDLYKFLLMKDQAWEIQKGLVIFANNAQDVFAKRAYENADCPSLDQYLAVLFANMEVGGRMVTLNNIVSYLMGSDWFRLDVFNSGEDAVSWGTGNKSINVYILTKLHKQWFCQNTECQGRGLPIDVINDGELCDECLYCDSKSLRCQRLDVPSRSDRREKEKEMQLKTLAEAMKLYKVNQMGSRKFTMNHMRAILLEVFHVTPDRSWRKGELLNELQKQAHEQPGKIDEALSKL